MRLRQLAQTTLRSVLVEVDRDESRKTVWLGKREEVNLRGNRFWIWGHTSPWGVKGRWWK